MKNHNYCYCISAYFFSVLFCSFCARDMLKRWMGTYITQSYQLALYWDQWVRKQSFFLLLWFVSFGSFPEYSGFSLCDNADSRNYRIQIKLFKKLCQQKRWFQQVKTDYDCLTENLNTFRYFRPVLKGETMRPQVPCQ